MVKPSHIIAFFLVPALFVGGEKSVIELGGGGYGRVE